MERVIETVGATRACDATGGKFRVLFVPGFVVDVYSEIERQYVELTAARDRDIEFLWLVPGIDSPCNNFAKAQSRETLQEPVWVQHLRKNGIPYIVANVSKYNAVSNFFLFRGIFREHPIDAVYTHFGFERFWATLYGKLYGKTTLWNEHWHSLGTRYIAAKQLFYRLFVDHFIAVSQFIADRLPSAARVHVLRNAIDADTSAADAPRKIERRRELGLPLDAKIVLLVSAFRENKRHDLALQVCERLLHEQPDVLFVFLGEGPKRQWVADQARQLGIDARIRMPGHVDNVGDYYAAADICMLTSIGEPCALAIFESMKYALPLIAFESGGTPEIIQSGETGVLVPEFDVARFSAELGDMIVDDEKRLQFGRNALAAVRAEADRDAWVRRLRTLLRDIVAERAVGGTNP